MVWVSPGMLETKVIVAPNSPIALAKPSTMPASTPGSASGRVTVANTRHGAATSVPAAWSSRPSTRPARSRTSGRRADQELEAVFLKDGLCRARAQESQIIRGLRLRGRRRRHGIDDCWMGIGREGADDLDAGLDLRIGGIDDAEHGFAARYQRQCRTHALGHREFRLGGLPRAQLLQRRLGVFADRHGLDVAGGDLAVAGKFREIETLSDIDIIDLGILRRDQH